MLDHLAIQLDIMVSIVVEITLDESAEGDAAQEMAAQFFQLHLQWPTELFPAVKTKEERFYGDVASMTEDFLRIQRDQWG